MAKKPKTDLEANIAKATSTAPAKHVTVGKRPAAEPAIAADTTAGDVPVHELPARPGSPCQKKGCAGRYSILHTEKVGRERVRKLICRTCQHQPDEPHRSPL